MDSNVERVALVYCMCQRQEVKACVKSWTGNTRKKSCPLCKVHLLVLLEKYNPVVQELLLSVSARAELASTSCLVRDNKTPRIIAIFRNKKKFLLCPDSRESEKQNCRSFRLGTEPFPRSSLREESIVRIQFLLMATLLSSSREVQVVLSCVAVNRKLKTRICASWKPMPEP